MSQDRGESFATHESECPRTTASACDAKALDDPKRPSAPLVRTGWFLAVMLVVIILHAFGTNGHWWYARDSVRYMGLARSLAETGTFSINGEPHIFALPGFPLMLSAVYRVFGESFLAMNILLALCAIGAVALFGLLLDQLPLSSGEKAAVFLLFGLSRTLFYYSRLIMTDVPFTLTAVAALYFSVKMIRSQGLAQAVWGAGAVIIVCVASSIRPVGPILAIALLAAIWLQAGARKRWVRNLGLTVALTSPLVLLGILWAWSSLAAGGAFSINYYHKFVGQRGAVVVLTNIVTRLPLAVDALSDVILGTNLAIAVNMLMAVLVLTGMWTLWRRGDRLLCAFGIGYLVAICVATPSRRYLLPALPVLLPWLVLGSGAVSRALVRRRGALVQHRAVQVTAILLLGAIGLNCTRIGKVILLARAPDFYEEQGDGNLSDYLELAEWFLAEAKENDRVLVRDVSVLQYFGRVKTLWFRSRPEDSDIESQVRRIRSNSITFMVKDDADEDSAQLMDQLIESHPRAFLMMRKFGTLTLYRVNRWRISQT